MNIAEFKRNHKVVFDYFDELNSKIFMYGTFFSGINVFLFLIGILSSLTCGLIVGYEAYMVYFGGNLSQDLNKPIGSLLSSLAVVGVSVIMDLVIINNLNKSKKFFVQLMTESFLQDLFTCVKNDKNDRQTEFNNAFKEFLILLEKDDDVSASELVNHFELLLELADKSRMEDIVVNKMRIFEEKTGNSVGVPAGMVFNADTLDNRKEKMFNI